MFLGTAKNAVPKNMEFGLITQKILKRLFK
jgi:hypothetical protein